MHELSIATAVLNTACKHAEGRPVTVVGMRVGGLRQVVAESLRFYFEIVARDTVCEGSRLDLVKIELELQCRECDSRWSPELPVFRCPACGSASVTIEAGDELEVEHIDVEEQEAKCIAPR